MLLGIDGVGAGAWTIVEAACAATIHVAETITLKNAPAMVEAYNRFGRVYPALRQIGRA
jgi:xylulokinase